MKGHIRERRPGHWAIVLDIDSDNGKRRQRWFSFAGTKRQAQVRCAALIAELQSDGGIDPSRLSVTAFLERWVEHMQGQVSPRTLERYVEIARKNLTPLLGRLPLTKLRPSHISAAYAKALATGRRDGKGGLSARTVTHMHRILREALQQALRWQMIARNPADAVKPPKVERKQMSVLDAGATAELIEAARPYTVFIPSCLVCCAACAAAKSRPCAGAPSILKPANSPSLPAWNRRKQAAARRKPNPGAPVPLRCRRS
jgi:hypothetical protein